MYEDVVNQFDEVKKFCEATVQKNCGLVYSQPNLPVIDKLLSRVCQRTANQDLKIISWSNNKTFKHSFPYIRTMLQFRVKTHLSQNSIYLSFIHRKSVRENGQER